MPSRTGGGTQLYTPWQMMKSNGPRSWVLQRADVSVEKLDVFDAQVVRGRPGASDLHDGEVYADEMSLRVLQGQRQQVLPHGAADFQHAAVLR